MWVGLCVVLCLGTLSYAQKPKKDPSRYPQYNRERVYYLAILLKGHSIELKLAASDRMPFNTLSTRDENS